MSFGFYKLLQCCLFVLHLSFCVITCILKGTILLFHEVLDAYGKPASGILEGHITWLGNFDECVSINMESPDKMNLKDGVRPNSSFIGKYCLLSVPISDEINVSYSFYSSLIFLEYLAHLWTCSFKIVLC
jgi:hypothetical protein